MTTRRVGHVVELDCIRGVALIVVLLSHLWIVWPEWVFGRTFSDAGFVGVDLFFVLSGFLITALLLDEQARTGAIRIGSFLWRRALRLLPALWLFLLAHAAYAVAADYPPFGNAGFEWESIRWAALFTMNWHVLWNPFSAADLSPLWSLSIEAQFYVVWPFVVVGLIGLRRSSRTVAAVLLVLLAAVTIRRFHLFETEGWEAAYLRSDSHVDGLLVGSLVGCAWIRGWTPDHLPRWLLWVGAATATAVFPFMHADQRFAYAGGTTLFVAACGLVVLVAVTSARRQLGPVGRAVAVIGRLSYGLYLWHFAVFWAATRWGKGWSDEARLASALAVIVVGVLVSRYAVELPAQRLGRGRRPAHAWAPPVLNEPSGERPSQTPD